MNARTLLYSISLVALLTGQSMLTSCSTADEVVPNETTQMLVTFTIAMDNELTRSGIWGEDVEREAKMTWENTIEQDKLQILFYDEDNKLIGQLSNLVYLSGIDDGSGYYSVVGTLDLDGTYNTVTLSGKVVVMANYDSPISGTAIAKEADMSMIGDNTFSYDADAIKNRTKYIPMWGVKSFSNIILRKGIASDIGQIDMLRAMAKIRLQLSTEKNSDDEVVADDYKLSDVYLDHYSTDGYTVPTGFESATDTYNLPTLTSFNSGNTTESRLDFETDITDQSYIIYMPEYPTGGTVPKINLTLYRNKDQATKQFIVELKNYTDGYATGGGLEILRNTIYEYTITKVIDTSEVQLTLRYQVQKWDTRSNEITFD